MRFLTAVEEQDLRTLPRQERDRKICDRIKAILLSNEGWTYKMIAKALIIDEKTVNAHIFDYKHEEEAKT